MALKVVTTCSICSEARSEIEDLYESLSPGPADPETVWECVHALSKFYPDLATYDAIPWLVEKFEPILEERRLTQLELLH